MLIRKPLHNYPPPLFHHIGNIMALHFLRTRAYSVRQSYIYFIKKTLIVGIFIIFATIISMYNLYK